MDISKFPDDIKNIIMKIKKKIIEDEFNACKKSYETPSPEANIARVDKRQIEELDNIREKHDLECLKKRNHSLYYIEKIYKKDNSPSNLKAKRKTPTPPRPKNSNSSSKKKTPTPPRPKNSNSSLKRKTPTPPRPKNSNSSLKRKTPTPPRPKNSNSSLKKKTPKDNDNWIIRWKDKNNSSKKKIQKDSDSWIKRWKDKKY
jgi:hypothetical protein